MTDLSQRIAGLSPEKRALLEAKLMGGKPAAAAPIPRRSTSGPAPLSFAQRRLWFLDQLDPGRAYYNLPLALRLTGELDVPALSRALDAIVARHESLRTTFTSRDGEPLQVVGDPFPVTLERRDLSRLDPRERAAELKTILAGELAKPFALARDPMLRAMLVRESADSHVLVLLMHHIASDGWSVGVLLQELASGYGAARSGSEAALPALSIQYPDFAVWQREWLEGGVGERQLAYWRERLAGDLPVLALPTDRPRPARQGYAGAPVRRRMPAALADRLEALCRESGATLFMALLAGFDALLARLSGQEDVLVGTPVAGRSRVETENLIGFFVNTLVVRTDLSGNPTFRDLLAGVRERALEAYGNQDVPFERLVEALRPERDLAHSPIFQAMFAFENYPLEFPRFPSLEIENVEFDTAVSNFDVTLDMSRQEDGLGAILEYRTDLFDAETAARWLENLEMLLTGAAAEPDTRLWDLPLLTPSERERLLVAWNATRADFPKDQCVHSLFEARAADSPESVAAEAGESRMTYRELDRRANGLARKLAVLGVGPDVAVGVRLERSLDAAVALLGVLKAGGCYVPLDPGYPAARLRYFLEDSGARVLLTDGAGAETFTGGPWTVVRVDESEAASAVAERPPDSGVAPKNLAYVIYTSGSTGRPKGVEISHRSLVNHAEAIRRAYGLVAADRVLQFASLSFDVAAEEIFPTWAAGATVVFRPSEAIGVAELESLLAAKRPTVVNLPAGFWHQWVSELARRPRPLVDSLRLVIAGSERVLPDRLEVWKRQTANVRWLNGYGPTETTITATLYEPAAGDTIAGAAVPIGRPLANVLLYVVDSHGGLSPQGAAGELWIGGEGVARGYRGDPERTADCFLANPFGAGRVYRTGDRVRYRSDGSLEFLGRLDAQVKVRGFRIELAEIESTLERHPQVREAAVAAREEGGETRLVGYVVFAGGNAPSAADLRAYAREQLPPYMVPSAFVPMDELPRTGSGKVDRDRLPDPGGWRAEEDYVAPRTPIEQAVAEIWSGLLRVERVGANDNFFELGGHSLLATQVVSRLRDRFSLEIPLKVLFESPRVADLALAIAQAQAGQASEEELARLLEELEGEQPSPPRSV